MIKDLQKLLKQVHDPNEYQLEAHNLNHPLYWVFKAKNAKLKDLDLKLRPIRKEHARFDILSIYKYIKPRMFLTNWS